LCEVSSHRLLLFEFLVANAAPIRGALLPKAPFKTCRFEKPKSLQDFSIYLTIRLTKPLKGDPTIIEKEFLYNHRLFAE
jgi:hypothetical protein